MMRRTFSVLAYALAATALCARPASAATVPVGPHEQFGGTVNGAGAGATVRMGCFGPEWPGKTGHPLAGQTIGAFVPEVARDASFGHTGARGRAIVARFVASTGVSRPAAVFTRFTVRRPVLSATAPLPTSLVLPCSGTGVVVFAPNPPGRDARAAYVRVSFAGQP